MNSKEVVIAVIKVTRINGEGFFINAEHIEHMEITPDTIITVTSGRKFIVKESPTEIIERVIAYRRQLFVELPVLTKRP